MSPGSRFGFRRPTAQFTIRLTISQPMSQPISTVGVAP